MAIARDPEIETVDDQRPERREPAPRGDRPVERSERGERPRTPVRTEDEEQSRDEQSNKRSAWDTLRAHPLAAAGAAILAAVLIVAGVAWWLHARHFE